MGSFFEGIADEQKEQHEDDEMDRHIKEFEHVVLDGFFKVDLIEAKS